MPRGPKDRKSTVKPSTSVRPTGQTAAQLAKEQALFDGLRSVKAWPMSPDSPSTTESSSKRQEDLVAAVQKDKPHLSREAILAEAKAWGEAD